MLTQLQPDATTLRTAKLRGRAPTMPDATTAPAGNLAIRPIPASSTHALRHRVLWPSVALEVQAQPYDVAEGTVHLGAFTSPASSSAPQPDESGAEPCGVLTLVIAPCPCALPAALQPSASSPPLQVQLRKFAVAPEMQGRGVGGAMLVAAVDEVRRIRDSAAGRTQDPPPALLHLDARREQAGFYERRGFCVLDPEVFVKKGPGGGGPDVEYVRMGRIV